MAPCCPKNDVSGCNFLSQLPTSSHSPLRHTCTAYIPFIFYPSPHDASSMLEMAQLPHPASHPALVLPCQPPEGYLIAPPSLHCPCFPLSYPRIRTLNLPMSPLLFPNAPPKTKLSGSLGNVSQTELKSSFSIHLQTGKLPSLSLRGFYDDRESRG